MNATDRPSGENAGDKSPRPVGGGDVSGRLEGVSSECRKIGGGSPAEGGSGNARSVPSGDQSTLAKEPYHSDLMPSGTSLRSGPPSAGTVKTPLSLPTSRVNASWPPSGDQAGYIAVPGRDVRRSGGPPSIRLT